ncbi:MAG: cytochrome c maturation protein CcmE [Gammaproteobacteria bacterium]|nr:cytochrome c maturation protein CcmE [Pseudomonadales bacterium]
MKPHRRKKLTIIGFIATGLAVAIGLSLYALSNTIDLFFTPSQVAAGEVADGQRIRIGGMVKEGSVEQSQDSLHVEFIATDYSHDLQVRYDGILPDLFREGQGVVVEGAVTNGVFEASRVLAKHDENYMSVEVKAALDAAERERTLPGVATEGGASGT